MFRRISDGNIKQEAIFTDDFLYEEALPKKFFLGRLVPQYLNNNKFIIIIQIFLFCSLAALHWMVEYFSVRFINRIYDCVCPYGPHEHYSVWRVYLSHD